jgi:ornithine cyclodeaminase/alanine dehydrogenase-like protein (mu-crystallin family)
MLILSHTDVEKAVSMRQAIEVMKDTFAQLSNNETNVPLRLHIPLETHNGIGLFMPAYLYKTEALAVKIVGVHYDNPSRGLPLIHAVVIALDAETGQPLALIEGSSVTALRTAAGAGAATDFLAREDSRIGVVFGAGVQAHTAIRAISTSRNLARVYVVGKTPSKVEELIEETRGIDNVPADVRMVENSEDAISFVVSQADIIYCATTSPIPLFDGSDVKPGTHVNAVGTFTPDKREVDTDFVKRCSKIVVDAYSGALAEAGDLIIPMEAGALKESDIYAELGEISSGKKAGRTNANEITFFKSVGNAAQDAAMAQAILKRAEELHLGMSVEL